LFRIVRDPGQKLVGSLLNQAASKTIDRWYEAHLSISDMICSWPWRHHRCGSAGTLGLPRMGVAAGGNVNRASQARSILSLPLYVSVRCNLCRWCSVLCCASGNQQPSSQIWPCLFAELMNILANADGRPPIYLRIQALGGMLARYWEENQGRLSANLVRIRS
jgi:hypothetical protein